MTQEFLDEIQRQNLYFRIANDLQLHLEERTCEEGPPSIKDVAKHNMSKVGHKHATMTPHRINEFTEWYYGAGELNAWCQEVPESFSSEHFDGMPWVPTIKREERCPYIDTPGDDGTLEWLEKLRRMRP